MRRRQWIIAIALVALAGGWAAFRPERLWIDQAVNETLEAAVAATPVSGDEAPRILARGGFHSGAHETAGMATIYAAGAGRRVLRLTDFHTSNGPDVRVYLVAAADVTQNATVTQVGFVELGALKGNVGDQNYEVPGDVDLERYRSVTIWCRRFGVAFGTAPLATSQS